MATTSSSESCTTVLTANAARQSLKRARILFSSSPSSSSTTTTASTSIIIPPVDKSVHKLSIARRIRNEYPIIPPDGAELPKDPSTLTGRILNEMRNDVINEIKHVNDDNNKDAKTTSTTSLALTTTTAAAVAAAITSNNNDNKATTTLTLHRETDLHENTTIPLPHQKITTTSTTLSTKPQHQNQQHQPILQKRTSSSSSTRIPTPTWHAPWKLSAVLSSHLGWVRCIAFDPSTNDMFATGGADRVIKIFDLAKSCVGAEDALKITLTGHVSAVRGLAFSKRHPYLFSAGEDKQVKCWDLETNQVIRHYHGHLSGVFALTLHPTLDVLITGGRDAVARVWDMRTKQQIHVLSGHENTVGAILTKSTDPQVITGSYDSTIKLWDLAAGKVMTTLTHHKKSVRALAQPSFENTFISGAADTLKKWSGKNGQFIKNFNGHAAAAVETTTKKNAVINALAINDDGVLFSGADDGTMAFWDYGSGYSFQKTETIPQPGSLDAENGIYAAEFDLTGSRLITCEADKTIKIWKEDDAASELTHPVDLVGWRKQCLMEAKQRV